ncbi:MAG: hypothetical protein F4Y14_05840 [Acidobacteria bacterium]|nr:hypothetical protein [Acidobacteriota bacterium]MYH72824.1 hypothetical protein [Acidimicrobiia bacterium]
MRTHLGTTATLCAILACSAAASSAADGPFGLAMGTPKDRFELESSETPGMFFLKDVPKPHSAFDLYILQFGPESGLCLVKGVGKDVSTNSFGTQLRSAFDDLRERLETAYGSHETIDFVRSGSLWDEPQYFMMGLLKQERLLAARWEQKQGSALKNNLETVLLMAKAASQDNGYLILEYYFENYDACTEELTRAEDDAL